MAKVAPQIPKEVQELIKTYQQAQNDLIRIIAESEAKGNVTAYRRKILTQVNAELTALNKYAADWSTDYVTKTYTASANAIWRELDKAGVDVSGATINKKALNKVVENTFGLLNDANRHVGRIMDDMIRQAGLEATKEKLVTGSTVKQMKENLVSKLSEDGLSAIRYRNGQLVKLDAYAGMVARTTATEATNRAVMQQMQDLDQDLVQMSNHYSSCPLCSAYEGRVYSISGKDKRYPELDTAFSGDYANIHPNCAHRITPYVEKFDDNAAQTREDSNKPFDTDEQSKAEQDAYNKSQTAKAELREDRNTYEDMKLLLPNDAPGSLSAFRAMKRSDNENYRMLMHDYIYTKKTIEKTT